MITHPEKVLFPADGITKGDLAAYYEAIAPLMLPHVRGRPLTMERYPQGIDKKGFIQKDVSKGFPDWLERIEVPKRGGSLQHVLASDVRSLLWVTNQNSITPHVWTSALPDLDHPDLCVFDLDPSEQEPEVLARAALLVRDVLTELGLRSWPKTSGSKGFHLVVPLDRASDFEEVFNFAHGVGAVLVARAPDILTQEFIKADREGRILVDTGRNGHGATVAAAYAVRAKNGAPVSAPCTWEELASGAVVPQSFTLRTMAERVAKVGDLWGELFDHPQSLASATERLDALLSAEQRAEARAASVRRPSSRKRKPKQSAE